MGGKSKSSSSTTNQNFNYDERIGASDNAVVYSNNIDGDNNLVTDLGAIDKAFQTVNTNTALNAQTLKNFSDGVFENNAKAFDTVKRTQEESYDLIKDFSDGMFDTINTTRSESYDMVNKNTRLAFEWANNATISADERIVNKALPLILIGGAILVLAVILKGKK